VQLRLIQSRIVHKKRYTCIFIAQTIIHVFIKMIFWRTRNNTKKKITRTIKSAFWAHLSNLIRTNTFWLIYYRTIDFLHFNVAFLKRFDDADKLNLFSHFIPSLSLSIYTLENFGRDVYYHYVILLLLIIISILFIF
jgi:hypothetical protein